MAGPQTDKIFVIDVYARTVQPSLLHVAKGERVAWTINHGSGVVVFEPHTTPPVNWNQGNGPAFSRTQHAEAPAGQDAGFFPHTIAVWFMIGDPPAGKKEQHSLQACLIVDG